MLRLGEKMARFFKVKTWYFYAEGTACVAQEEDFCLHNYITEEVIIESELDKIINLTVMQ
jgi:hypothetical protein